MPHSIETDHSKLIRYPQIFRVSIFFVSFTVPRKTPGKCPTTSERDPVRGNATAIRTFTFLLDKIPTCISFVSMILSTTTSRVTHNPTKAITFQMKTKAKYLNDMKQILFYAVHEPIVTTCAWWQWPGHSSPMQTLYAKTPAGKFSDCLPKAPLAVFGDSIPTFSIYANLQIGPHRRNSLGWNVIWTVYLFLIRCGKISNESHEGGGLGGFHTSGLALQKGLCAPKHIFWANSFSTTVLASCHIN